MLKESLAFDDVLLQPKHSDITSRSEIDVSVTIGKFKFSLPVVPANMKTVVGQEMMEQFVQRKSLVILHRFDSLENQLKVFENLKAKYEDAFLYAACSVGVKDNDKDCAKAFYDLGVRIFCIDIAHGDSKACLNMSKYLKETYPDILLIAGNVATPDGAQRLWEVGVDVVKSGVGSGCVSKDTRILMSDGVYKNITDVRPGDEVINMHGNAVKVIDNFCTGTKEVTKLRNSIWYEDTYVTTNHQYYVADLNSVSKATISKHGYAKLADQLTRYDQSKYKWKQVDDLEQDVFLMPKNINFKLPETFKIELMKKTGGNHKAPVYTVDTVLQPSYELGYIFGLFLGDGCSLSTQHNGSHIGGVSWYLGKSDKDVTALCKLEKSLNFVFGKYGYVKSGTQENHPGINIVKLHYKPFGDFLSKFGKHDKKHLPKELLVNNKEYLKGIQEGLIDSDGNIEKGGRINLTNTSPQIIELFNVVTYLLTGVFPNNQKCKISVGGLKGAKLENMKQSYQSRINTTAVKRLTKNFQCAKKLSDTSKIYAEVPVYDITVDCPTHSFIANNAIVHNSICLTRVETGNGVPQLSCVMEIAARKKELEAKLGRKLYFISDGGHKSVGDVVKALCFADIIMAGNLFAGTNETPGEVLSVNGQHLKTYDGSSTHKPNHVEGVTALVTSKGPVSKMIQKIVEGVRSGCSYQGCRNLDELKEDPIFVRITSAGLKESNHHDVIVRE